MGEIFFEDSEVSLMIAICKHLNISHQLMFAGGQCYSSVSIYVADGSAPTGWIEMKGIRGLARWISEHLDPKEVIGNCPKCKSHVPRGFYECRGDGSHHSMAQKR